MTENAPPISQEEPLEHFASRLRRWRSVLEDLNRRRVMRVVAGYAVGAWLIPHVTDVGEGGPGARSRVDGIDLALRRGLRESGVLWPVPGVGVHAVGEFTLWVSIESHAGSARLRALLLDSTGERHYPYVDDLDFEIDPKTGAEGGNAAGAHGLPGTDGADTLASRVADHVVGRIGSALAAGTTFSNSGARVPAS